MLHSTVVSQVLRGAWVRAAAYECAVNNLVSLSGMSADWCRGLIEREGRDAWHLSPTEIAKRMTTALAFGSCSLDDDGERVTWVFGDRRWWREP